MNIFITGATGFIGPGLALQLAAQGHQVHALVRSLEKGKAIEHENIHLHKGDLLDKESVKRAMKGCQQVYHVAAYMVPWDPDPGKSFRINVGGSLNVFEAAAELGVEKVLFTSTTGVLGPSNGKKVTENHIRIADFFHDYESAKIIAEERFLRYILAGKFEGVVVYPSRVYGPEVYQDSAIVTSMIRRFLAGNWHLIPGDGTKLGNYAYIDDVVDGHIQAMAKGRNGEGYLLAGEEVDWNDFWRVVMEVSGQKHWMIRLPGLGNHGCGSI